MLIECTQAIETIVQANFFIVMFFSLFFYDFVRWLTRRAFAYFERKSWGPSHGEQV